MSKRPPFVRHYSELPSERGSYPGDDELMSQGTALSRPLGLKRLGIHHEMLPPGSRTSWPHAEEKEEEFCYVLEGTPDVWIDGVLHRLQPGDAVAFLPGTGIAHTLINNTEENVRLLIVGEHFRDNRILFAFHPQGYAGMRRSRLWTDAPVRERGAHDGLPDALRTSRPPR
jgi:uncharacterized cupin superfamily protein